MRRTAIPHFNPFLNTSKLKIEIQIDMKLYIFYFSECSTVAEICNTESLLRWEAGLTNTSLAELGERPHAAEDLLLGRLPVEELQDRHRQLSADVVEDLQGREEERRQIWRIYKVVHQVVRYILLTSKQKFHHRIDQWLSDRYNKI